MEIRSKGNSIILKMFDAAFKEKISQLSREYDPNLVFELWSQMASTGGVKDYFRKWKWTPDMTIAEAVSSLENYVNGLESLLQNKVIPFKNHKK